MSVLTGISTRLDAIRAAWREHQRIRGRSRLHDKATKRYYVEGDIAPDSLLNRPPGSGPIGAMISIDPETTRIIKIFHP